MESFKPKKLPSESRTVNTDAEGKRPGFIPFSKAFFNEDEKSHKVETQEISHAAHGQSIVEYVEDQGVVKKIIVTCGCGSVTEIDCVYESE